MIEIHTLMIILHIDNNSNKINGLCIQRVEDASEGEPSRGPRLLQFRSAAIEQNTQGIRALRQHGAQIERANQQPHLPRWPRILQHRRPAQWREDHRLQRDGRHQNFRNFKTSSRFQIRSGAIQRREGGESHPRTRRIVFPSLFSNLKGLEVRPKMMSTNTTAKPKIL